MTCQLCESEKPLVNSHIIPRSFYEIGKIHPNESSKIISTKDGWMQELLAETVGHGRD